MTTNNNFIYHFTSIDSFLNIIKNREIWLFDIQKSNDPQEGKLWISALFQSLRHGGVDCDKDILGQLYSKVFKFRETIKNSDYEKMKFICLCSSFCEYNENNELYLWRTYGDNGNGIAIGFEKPFLKELASRNKFVFNTVKYKTKEEIMYIATNFLNEQIHNWEETTCSDKIGQAIEESFIGNGYFLKLKQHSIEHESRIAFYNHFNDEKKVECVQINKSIKFYYPLKFNKDYDVKLNIILGNNCSASVAEIKKVLEINNYNGFNVERESDQLFQ